MSVMISALMDTIQPSWLAQSPAKQAPGCPAGHRCTVLGLHGIPPGGRAKVVQHRPRNNRKIMESLLLLLTLHHTLSSTPPGPWHGSPPWVLCPENTGRREGGWPVSQGGRGRHLNSVSAGAALPGPRGAGGPQECVCLCGSPAVVMAGVARKEAGSGTGRLFPGPAWRVNKQPSRAARVNGGGATGRRVLPRHWHHPPPPLPPHCLALLAPTCRSLPHRPAAPHTR